MANMQRIEILRDQLSRLPDEKIKMEDFILHEQGNCGTVACIAGWCSLLNGGPDSNDMAPIPGRDVNPVFNYAQDWLELTLDEAHHLFYGHGPWANWANGDTYSLREVTKQEVLAEFDRILSEGFIIDPDIHRPMFDDDEFFLEEDNENATDTA